MVDWFFMIFEKSACDTWAVNLFTTQFSLQCKGHNFVSDCLLSTVVFVQLYHED